VSKLSTIDGIGKL